MAGDAAAKPNSMTFISIGVVMMGAAMFGADQNNYGVSYGLKSFGDYWCPVVVGGNFDCSNIAGMDDTPASWGLFIDLGSTLLTIGMMIGALIPGPLAASFLGRRLCTSIGGFLTFFGCLVVAYLTFSNVIIYYIGRIITGLGVGMCCFVLPMYNSEVSTLNIRGTTGSLFQFMCVIGGFIAIIALIFVKDWTQGFLFPGYFGIVVGLAVWMCPESPRYLADRYGVDRARPALQRVREGNVEEELAFIDECLRHEREAGTTSYADLFLKPGLRKRVFVAAYLQAAQQLTGVNAFLGYQSDIWKSAGVHPEDQLWNNGPGPGVILQMVFVIGCVTGLVLVDSKYGGRKCQLLSASIFMGPPLILAAIVLMAHMSPKVIMYCVFVFAFGFQMAWGIVPWFYPAELFTMQEKERALSISTFCGFLFNVIINLITKLIYDKSQVAMYLLYGALNVSNLVFVSVMMKETKGVALEDIPGLFDGSAKDCKTAPLV